MTPGHRGTLIEESSATPTSRCCNGRTRRAKELSLQRILEQRIDGRVVSETFSSIENFRPNALPTSGMREFFCVTILRIMFLVTRDMPR